jgi:hypothetical protein
MVSKILALIDGSVYARSVCELSAWAATRIGASVEIAHVLGRRGVSSAPIDLSGNLEPHQRAGLLKELADLDEQRGKLALQRGRAILDDAKALVASAGASDVTARLRNGDLMDALADLESDAEIVVIGKRGEAADSRSFISAPIWNA